MHCIVNPLCWFIHVLGCDTLPRSAAVALEEVISLGVELALTPQAAAEVTQAIAAGAVKIPSRSTLLGARQKLDILSMYYQRRINKSGVFIRHLSIDSSPQVRHDFLCVRERRIRVADGLQGPETVGAHHEQEPAMHFHGVWKDQPVQQDLQCIPCSGA